ncbi:MAG: hypothetical protein MJ252_01185 [archaeon]|nr:hypothetical protein [archaeon]
MPSNTLLKISLLLFLISFCSSTVRITGPEEFISSVEGRKVTFESVMSKFGVRGENFAINAKIVYNPDSTNKDGCLPFTDYYYEIEPYPINFPVFLVHRGNCTFTTKARNAQNAGALAVLLINHRDENLGSVILSDDGTASDVNIPVIMVNKKDGSKIDAFFQDNKSDRVLINQVTAVIEHLPELTKSVTVDLFFTPDSKATYEFLEGFQGALFELKDKVTLVPHYINYKQTSYSFAEEKDCIGKKKYCLPSSDKEVRGQKILIESLYQKCIYRVYGVSTSASYNLEDYFGYFRRFNENCLNNKDKDAKDNYFSERCRIEALDDNDLDIDLVENCIAASYDRSVFSDEIFENKENSLLDEDFQQMKQYEVRDYPAIFLNKEHFEGNISPMEVVGKICDMLSEKEGFCKDLLEAKVEEKTNKPKKKSIIFIIIIASLIIAFNVGVYFLCRKYLANKISEKIGSGSIDMDGKINNTVSKYFQLQEKI